MGFPSFHRPWQFHKPWAFRPGSEVAFVVKELIFTRYKASSERRAANAPRDVAPSHVGSVSRGTVERQRRVADGRSPTNMKIIRFIYKDGWSHYSHYWDVSD